jgi:hypothetical protein
MQYKALYYDAVIVKSTTPWANETTFSPDNREKGRARSVEGEACKASKRMGAHQASIAGCVGPDNRA